ncbi:low molecular weight phosphatase family protein [Mycolicibacterium sp.]|uniref:arsenate reductase/protein-tyrosine-phosphatase family protein n=1 Tax=Mycolicibacterium sp. TaxID=2320850 RepID=UPI003D0D3CE1
MGEPAPLIERGASLHVLFICTGNICRSPMAERLAAAYGAQLQIPNFNVSSAGTRAMVASPIHPDAAVVLERLGGDASDFAARRFTPNIGLQADLVLTMTRAHRDTVLEVAPRILRKVFTLTEAELLISQFNPRDVSDLGGLRSYVAAHDLTDILDPIGQDAEFFARVGSQIASVLPPVLEFCRSLPD